MNPHPVETLQYYNPIPFTTRETAWRFGKTLIITKDAVLPDRCVKCNVDTHNHRFRRKISWHPWYMVVLLFLAPFGLLLPLVFYLILKKTMLVDIAVCPRHRRQRRARIALTFVTLLYGIYLLVYGMGHVQHLVAILGVAMMITSAFLGASAQILRPKKIDPRHGYFRGAGPEFLDSLPGLATQPT